jgi:putative inorganic carbon (HCO3(-)) transporter
VRDIVLTLIVAVLVCGTFMRPWLGVLTFVWLSYMTPQRMCYGFAAGLPFSMVVGVVTLVAMLASSDFKWIPLTRETVLLLSLVVWMNITTLSAINPAGAIIRVQISCSPTFPALRTLGITRL